MMNRYCKNGTILAAALGGSILVSGCSGGGATNKPDRDIVVSQVSGPTSEMGEQATVTIHLNAKPARDVVIAVSSSDTAEGTVSPATLTFTRENYAAPQTITVAGVDDQEADGDTIFEVLLEPTSDDEVYAAAILPAIPVTNLDDDTAGVRVGPVSGSTSEAGTTAMIPVRLKSRPTSDVLLIFGVSDLSEASTSAQSMLFTPDDWNAPQDIVVTGVDDPSADGNVEYLLLFQSAASEDPRYAGLPVPSVPLVNLDDDTAGILFSTSSIVTDEFEGPVTFEMWLQSRPTASVIVTLDESNSLEGDLATTTFTFTSSNWNVPQTVTVRGDDDSLDDGDQLYTIFVSSITSLDLGYKNLSTAAFSVQALNLDNDGVGIRTTPLTNATSETGNGASFTIRLDAAPTADVVIPVSSTDLTEGRPSLTEVTFTTANWSTPRTVSVSGPLDFVRDGHQPYQITFGTAQSTDTRYAGLQPPPLGGFNIDDGPIKRVLVYDDAFGTYADDAAAALGYTVVTATNTTAFNAAFDSLEELETVVIEASSGPIDLSMETRLVAWAGSAQKLVFSYWDLDGSMALQNALEVVASNVFTSPRFVFPTLGETPDLFNTPNQIAAPLVGNDVAADNGSELALSGAGKILGEYDMNGGPGAIALTSSGSIVTFGFMPDDFDGVDAPADGVEDMQELYMNAMLATAAGNLPPSPQRFDNNTPLAIPDTSGAAAVDSTITVTNLPVNVTKVKVLLHITHTWLSDLDMWLVGPDGTIVELSTDNGSSADNYGTACSPDSSRTTFDDDAATAVTSGTAPFAGSFRPEQPLTAFIGKAAEGTWSLRIDDDASSDAGTLHCWSLILEY